MASTDGTCLVTDDAGKIHEGPLQDDEFARSKGRVAGTHSVIGMPFDNADGNLGRIKGCFELR